MSEPLRQSLGSMPAIFAARFIAECGFSVVGYCGTLADIDLDEATRRSLIPVTNLGLSVRPLNCLRSLGVTTLGELIETSTDELLRQPNMGQKSLGEIRDRLAKEDLKSGTRPRNGRPLDLRLLLRFADLDAALATATADAGYSAIWKVCAISLEELRLSIGTKVAAKIQELLESIGTPMETVVPKWLPPIHETVRLYYLDELALICQGFREVLRLGPGSIANSFASEPSRSLSDEIDRFIMAGLNPNKKKAISIRKGWDGGSGASLEEVGRRFNVSRERIRQIESLLRPKVPAGGFIFIERAVRVIESLLPCPVDTAEAAVQAQVPGDFALKVEGIMGAAREAHINTQFRVERVGRQKWVATDNALEEIKGIESRARADVSSYGAGSLDRLCETLSSVDRNCVKDLVGILMDAYGTPHHRTASICPPPAMPC